MINEIYNDIEVLIEKPRNDLDNANKVIVRLIDIINEEIQIIKNRDKDNLKLIQKPKELLLTHIKKLHDYLEENPNFLKDNLDNENIDKWRFLIKKLDEKFEQYNKEITITNQVNNKLLEILHTAILNENTKDIAYNKQGNLIRVRKSEES